MQFILKLNETTFKPLFLRTYDWAVIDLAEENEDGSKHTAALSARRTVLYKLVDRLLVQLKVRLSFLLFWLRGDADGCCDSRSWFRSSRSCWIRLSIYSNLSLEDICEIRFCGVRSRRL